MKPFLDSVLDHLRWLGGHILEAIAIVSLAVIWFVGVSKIVDPPRPIYLVVNCEEDQPCWNCATMGNRVCGNP